MELLSAATRELQHLWVNATCAREYDRIARYFGIPENISEVYSPPEGDHSYTETGRRIFRPHFSLVDVKINLMRLRRISGVASGISTALYLTTAFKEFPVVPQAIGLASLAILGTNMVLDRMMQGRIMNRS